LRVLIKEADYVITLDKSRRVIRGGSLVIEDGAITKVARQNEIQGLYPNASFDQIIDAKNRVATPGFIDTHLHTQEHLARGLFPDDVHTLEWTLDWAYPFYGTSTSEDEYYSALLCCADMLKTGTTCFMESGVRYPDSLGRALIETGMRGIVGLRVMDNVPKPIPSGWNQELTSSLYFTSAEKAMAETKSTIEKWNHKERDRLRAWVTINGKATCTDELYVRAAELAARLNVGMHFHMASSLKEAEDSQKKRGCWPMTYLNRLGVLSERVLIAHATAVANEEIKLLADKDVKISFCPGSAMKLAKGASIHGKFPEMLRAGIAVSLGCDGTAAAGTFDMVRQIHMAAGMLKDGRVDPTAVLAEQALEMGTIMGARALRWEDKIGSLEEGKRADVVLFDVRRPEWQPNTDPVQNLVYSATGNSVTTVLVDGRIVVHEGKLQTISEDFILDMASKAAERSIARAGLTPKRKWLYS